MIITFLGHAHISMNDRIKETVKAQIRSLLTGKPITCYLGGYGDFDDICARACKELKQKYDIETVYVTPYVTLSEQEKIKEMQRCGLCDTSIYPPIENTPPKFAISKRNEWMVTHADVIIAYVNRSYGGAYQSLQTAKHRKKKIINICELL